MSKIRVSGGYRRLASFQTTTLIYDATVWFCQRFLDSRSRTVDQMVQAARSGRQNIAEGSRAAAASSQTELRLVNVARASLEELLLDYEDYLRHRNLALWDRNSDPACAVRLIPQQYRSNPMDGLEFTALSDQQRWSLYGKWLDCDDAAMRANAVICLIHQANYLLDQQITALEQQFVTEGGYSERLAAARIAHRAGDVEQPKNGAPSPTCQQCGKPMSLRTVKQGRSRGQQFWGCVGYPDCRATQPV